VIETLGNRHDAVREALLTVRGVIDSMRADIDSLDDPG